MTGADQFHVGVVVDDLDGALADLADLFGYEWCEQIAVPTEVRLPEGDLTIDLRFTYSRTTPRLEVIQTVPGTLWSPAAGSGVHHIGYWSDDVAADSARLAARGHPAEATGIRPDGTPHWAYHRGPDGPRIELVSRALEAGLRGYWEASSER